MEIPFLTKKTNIKGAERTTASISLQAAFKDKSALEFDLLYLLSYMSVIASAGVPRKLIFEFAARLPCSSASYVHRVELACVSLKYDYAKACRIVGESAKDAKIKELLLRFSSSLLSGEPEADFLSREAEAQIEEYDNDYLRRLEGLKLWTDAYISLILSAVLVVIMGVISTLIWPVSMTFLLGLVFMSAVSTALGVWLIYVMSPRESMVLREPSSSEQLLAKKLFWMCLPACAVVSFVLILLGVNTGWVLVLVGFLSIPIGFISIRDDGKIVRRDFEIGTLLASLGGVSAAIGTTVKDALSRLDLNAINTLRKEVKHLNTRLFAGLNPALCWEKFVSESGSELVNRSVRMFYDAISVGGEPEKAGDRTSHFAGRLAQLRARRKTVANPFRWLCIAMHASVIALLIFVTEVISMFGRVVSEAEKSLPSLGGGASISSFTSFNITSMETLRTLVIPLVIIFTIANTLAPGIADGGSRYKLLFNLGINSLISGFSLIMIPAMAQGIFTQVKV